MRLPHPRFTVRHLMVAVMIALSLLASSLLGRPMIFESRADDHGLAEMTCLSNSRGESAQANYHHVLYMKYRHAARHPWLPVEPDPPEPKD